VVAESPDSDDAREIADRGWRQFSVVPPVLLQELRADLPNGLPADAVLLVASHDCDVANPSFEAEPQVELLVARYVDAIDGNLTHGKNPRRLQLDLQTPAGARPCEVSVNDKCWVSRRGLMRHRPFDGHSLAPSDRRMTARWLSKRYDRAAFPNAFNERLSGARAQVRQLLRRSGQHLEGLYVAVPEEELPVGQPYELLLQGLISVETAASLELRTQAQECLDRLAGILDGCPGIEVLESTLVSEDQFTVDDVNRTKRWDWDWLSGENQS
jgi:hypothetical protein